MDDELLSRFFLEPSSAPQRRYEALRAVFVEGRSQKEAAACFGYSYEGFRQLVHDFREELRGGQAPPFSSKHDAADRLSSGVPSSPFSPIGPPSPMRAP